MQERRVVQREKKVCTWTNHNGVTRPVAEMEDMHLFSSVAWYLRQQQLLRTLRPKLPVLKREMVKRGIPIPILQDLK